MPIYQHRCSVCSKEVEEYRKLDDYDKHPLCCGQPMPKFFTGHSVIPDLEPYIDEHLADRPVLVKSKKHKKQLMKEHNVRERMDYFS